MGSPVRLQAVGYMEKYTAGGFDDGAVREVLVEGGWDGRSDPSLELCHWLLWKLGCRDSRILSRDVPELRICRTDGLFQRLCYGSQRLAAWRSFRLESVPEPGDIVLSGSRLRGEQESARVFMSAGPSGWRLVGVQADLHGVPRVVEVAAEVRGEDLVVGGRKERLAGWVDLLAALGDGADVGQ